MQPWNTMLLLEALRGQTIGKRAMGLRVESAGGGPAGLNSISARTVLRLIDGQVLYLVGLLVAVLTGSRRRRLGDWLGRTVVVRDDATRKDVPVQRLPQRPLWQVLAYPLSWIAAVLVATFALGLGTAAGADEQAISLVRSYIQARERGDGALACSLLTSEQQREIVALQTRDYRDADVARCPAMILANDPGSHLLNPNLDAFAAGPLTARYSSAGVAQVLSRSVPGLELIVVLQRGRARLDVRGVQRLRFVRGCDADGVVSSAQCDCVFDNLRADGLLGAALEGKLTPAITAQARACRSA